MSAILQGLISHTTKSTIVSVKGVDIDTSFAAVIWDDAEPVTVIRPSSQGPWICGGAALAWYRGRAVESDIDVFCASSEQITEVYTRVMATKNAQVKMDTANAITIAYTSKAGSEWTIQIIKKTIFDNIQAVLDNFDISVCKIGTDGYQYYTLPGVYEDINSRVLRMSFPLKPGAAKRYMKYVAYGFRPVPGLHKQICDSTETKWEYDFGEDYDAM